MGESRPFQHIHTSHIFNLSCPRRVFVDAERLNSLEDINSGAISPEQFLDDFRVLCAFLLVRWRATFAPGSVGI